MILYGLDEEEIKSRIIKSEPDLIGVSCLFSNRGQETLKICSIAKEAVPDAHVVMGGQHPSGVLELVLEDSIDYIIYGEAENAFLKLINMINNGGNLEEVPQIILKKNQSYWKSPNVD